MIKTGNKWFILLIIYHETFDKVRNIFNFSFNRGS